MPSITFQDKAYACSPNETVLECLERQGLEISSSCRSGVCQTCLLRAVAGTPPLPAQQGLKDTLRARGYFLSCICKPLEDLTVVLPGAEAVSRVAAQLVARDYLNRDILRLTLRCLEPFAYRPGQFIQIHRQDGLIRSYSIASLPVEEGTLELHVRRLTDGVMSGWLHDSVQVGDILQIAGPSGNSFYLPDNPERNLLFIGTGSGLAPLWGIARDALQQGHTGTIQLYHGSYALEGLYLRAELTQLAESFPNFHYTPCVDSGEDSNVRQDRADCAAFSDLPSLKEWRVYLCGHPGMVASAKRRAYLSGAALADIYADPFLLSLPR